MTIAAALSFAIADILIALVPVIGIIWLIVWLVRRRR